LVGGAPRPVPRADGAGFSVVPSSATRHEVPVWSVSLAVEGVAGVGARTLDPASPNPWGLSRVSREVLEVVYQVSDMDEQVDDAALMAARGFSASLRENGAGTVELTSKEGLTRPRLRSKAGASVSGGDDQENFLAADGQVITSDATFSARYDSTQVEVLPDDANDPFYRLTWEDVRKPEPGGPTLKAGTYVWWDNGSLHYYDMPYSEYVDFIRENPLNEGAPATLPGAIGVSNADHRLTLSESVVVESTANSQELSLVTREGAPEEPPDPNGGTASGVASTIVSSGRVEEFIRLTQTSPTGRIDVYDGGGQFQGFIDWNPGFPQTIVNYNGNVELVLQIILDPSAGSGYSVSNNNVNAVTVPAAVTALGLAPGDPPGSVNPPGVTDRLTASDLKIAFEGDGEQVVLYSEGDIRLTGAITGEGGSIVTGGNLRITGLGADLSASTTQGEGVNMYARGDIVFSTLDETDPGQFAYRDVRLRGVVYSWGDFTANLGSELLADAWGRLNIEGALIAYGGNPEDAEPGSNGRGRVDIRAEAARLTFDPSYLGGLVQRLPAGFQFRALSWSNRP
ncbi:MAG: hypothetical protein AB1758_35975, partial [Candidatus Eremiobacterota bacterium]